MNDWKVCLEVGINHLGSFNMIERILEDTNISNLDVSITVQIKEEEFYKTNKEFILTLEEHDRFIEICKNKKIPCGLAFGPLTDLTPYTKGFSQPDFIKTLSISSADEEFMERIYSNFECPKYISVGLSKFSYIEKKIKPIMNENDKLIHTSLSHNARDQNLGDLNFLKSLGFEVFYGLHAINTELIFTAIGAGADGIFFYIGDKGLNLPDYDHAIDLKNIEEIYNDINLCFSAMKESGNSPKETKINFIG